VSPARGSSKPHCRGNPLFQIRRDVQPALRRTVHLLLVTHSHWDHKDGNSTLSIKYKLLDSAGNTLIEGEKHDDMNTIKLFQTNGFLSLSFAS